MKKSKTLPKPPKFYEQFVEKYPAVAGTYEKLGNAIHEQGPLTDRDRAFN
jgi:hypothetical protein